MSQQIAIKTISAPALASAFGGYAEDDLTAGVGAGFGVLSYRGKVWRINYKSDEHKLITPDGDPIPSVRVIMLKAKPQLSKIYYAKQYEDGDDSSPDCFSMDGVTPDRSIKAPQCGTCAACPQNIWGSKITDAGKETKACSDSRRLAVVPANDVANEALGGPLLLRVPAASLSNLSAYDSLLRQANAAYFGLVTKVSFDTDAAYPKLTFEYDGAATELLSEAAGQQILAHRSGEQVNRILEEQVAGEHAAASETTQPPAPQPAAAPTVVEPIVVAPAPAPVAAPAPAPAVDVSGGFGGAVAPAPAPAPAPAAVVPVVESPAAPPAPAPAEVAAVDAGAAPVEPAVDDIDALVDGLLGGKA
jgi:hypothetical protein